MKKVFGLLVLTSVFYVFGAITVHYKLFPFQQILELKNYINKSPVLQNPHYVDRTSQFNILSSSNKNFKVVMIGDSITSGGEWHELLDYSLVQNRGIGSDTTNGVLNRLDSINGNIEKSFIMIGINDIAMGKSINEIYDNYSKIIDQLNSRNIEVFIQSVLYVAKKYPNSKEINSKVLELNNRLIELANDKNIKFIELNLILSEDKFLKEKYQNDGIHLNGEAYQLWANEIKTFVK